VKSLYGDGFSHKEERLLSDVMKVLGLQNSCISIFDFVIKNSRNHKPLSLAHEIDQWIQLGYNKNKISSIININTQRAGSHILPLTVFNDSQFLDLFKNNIKSTYHLKLNERYLESKLNNLNLKVCEGIYEGLNGITVAITTNNSKDDFIFSSLSRVNINFIKLQIDNILKSVPLLTSLQGKANNIDLLNNDDLNKAINTIRSCEECYSYEINYRLDFSHNKNALYYPNAIKIKLKEELLAKSTAPIEEKINCIERINERAKELLKDEIDASKSASLCGLVDLGVLSTVLFLKRLGYQDIAILKPTARGALVDNSQYQPPPTSLPDIRLQSFPQLPIERADMVAISIKGMIDEEIIKQYFTKKSESSSDTKTKIARTVAACALMLVKAMNDIVAMVQEE
jgi:hypothetical protein